MAAIPLSELEHEYVVFAQRESAQFLQERLARVLRAHGLDPLKGPYTFDMADGVMVVRIPDAPPKEPEPSP